MTNHKKGDFTMDKKVKIVSKKRVFDGFFKIDEVKISYEQFDGEMSPIVSRLNFERGDSVAAIIFNSDTQKIILVNQFKYPAYDKGPGWITETVAGIIDENESPETAIKREILEEIGYYASQIEHISTFYVSPGGSSERIILYYVEVNESGKQNRGGGVKSEGEDIISIEMTIDEAKHQIEKNGIVDAKTLIGLMWFFTKFHTK